MVGDICSISKAEILVENVGGHMAIDSNLLS